MLDTGLWMLDKKAYQLFLLASLMNLAKIQYLASLCISVSLKKLDSFVKFSDYNRRLVYRIFAYLNLQSLQARRVRHAARSF